jgi:hypothetical protein
MWLSQKVSERDCLNQELELREQALKISSRIYTGPETGASLSILRNKEVIVATAVSE